MLDNDPLHDHEDELGEDELGEDELGEDELGEEELEEHDAGEDVLALRERMSDISPSLIELEKIPQRLWEQTLAPLHRQQRYWIAQQVADTRLRTLAGDLAFELDMAECDAANVRARTRNAARRTGYPLPTPAHEHAAARSSVQVNIRLRRDDHERLAHAASAVGLKPTTLARSLVLNGATMILREHGEEHLTPPNRATPRYPLG